ncbi:MAG: hypothetical protein EVG15_07505 [Candidatus Acididesulfobacter diazotrophicus]|jgi:hypothetical protein|uniref:Uncharacterized protein n=1 Tax=Candidatus Acididesulfobacter diazotrophicus TaxID=2597226 RepID=A0A519BLL8_9DELT|nr:MAG: hypothetical protein EVG15_07505 [Candidatus Acididesulfobacter diazotrophicus]
MEKIKLENKENNSNKLLFEKNNNDIDYDAVCENKTEIYKGIAVIKKIKKSEKHFFEYFIGLW